MTRSSNSARQARNSTESDKEEKRRLRNRLAQRAFRRRQAEQVRELQTRVEISGQPDSERIITLEQENSRLRTHFMQIQSQIEGLQASLHLISDSVTSILGGPASQTEQDAELKKGKEVSEELALPSNSGSSLLYEAHDSPEDPPFTLNNTSVMEEPQPMLRLPKELIDDNLVTDSLIQTPEQLGPRILQEFGHDSTGFISTLATSALDLQRIPDLWAFDYQMDILSGSPTPSDSNVLSWTPSNSPFSDHIQVLKRLLLRKLKQPFITTKRSCEAIYQTVSAVLSMFNSITRPDAMNWYAKTRFFHIVELTAWQILPCPTTYTRLHERYRPTNLQLTMEGQYPCVVDWIPFASIRDLLIQLHPDNPHVDQIFCDTVSAYVVECALDELVRASPPVKVYIRVTDLISSMYLTPNGKDRPDTPLSLPAPNVNSIFCTPELAELAFKHLKMDCGASTYKIDPEFFSKYPELCDPSDNIMASGIPLKPKTQKILPRPYHLDRLTIETYCSFINFSFN